MKSAPLSGGLAAPLLPLDSHSRRTSSSHDRELQAMEPLYEDGGEESSSGIAPLPHRDAHSRMVRSSLLDDEGEEDAAAAAAAGEANASSGHSSLSSATLTLTISAAGAGVLSFAYACMVMGIMAAVVCTLLFASLNAYTLHTLCRLCHLHAPRMVGHSYEEMVRLALGERAFLFCLATIIVGGIGALTGYLLIMASLLHQVLWSVCTSTDEASGMLLNHCGFWSSRTAIVLILCICVIYPISFCKSLHDLSFSTWLSFSTVLAVMVAVAYRGIEALSHGYPSSEAQQHVEGSDGLWVNLAPRFFLGWPIILFSLGCHLQLPLVYMELSPAIRRRAMSRQVIPTMSLIVVLLYLVTGITGFVTFGRSTQGNILLNYSVADDLANAAKALMALHITLAFPVCLFPSRAALDFFARTFYGIEPCTRNSAIQSLAIISLSALLAVFIPQVQTVFGLLGSTIAVSQTYLFPGLMLLASTNTPEKLASAVVAGPDQNRWNWDRRAGWALVVWSAITCVLGTTATLVDMIE